MRWVRSLVGVVIAALVMLPASSNAALVRATGPHQLVDGALDRPSGLNVSPSDHGEHCTCVHGQSQSCCDSSDENSGCNRCGGVVAVPASIAFVTPSAFAWEIPAPPAGGGLTISPETKPPPLLQPHRYPTHRR
ncbi:MAG: hypothetical protein WA970_06270 [Gammaproteobacteria bacterium]